MKILPKIKDNVSKRQYKLQCNSSVEMQDDVAQQWWYSTILAANIISNTGKVAKMVLPDFFREDGGKIPHQSDSKN